MKRTALAALLLFALLSAAPARAQGCIQCRDNTAATPSATRRAYRHAIILMAGAGCGLFITTLVLLKRQN
ncbi:MAG TPA: copper resistance protein CopC [Edaphobacter sp.]|nr:copper resistance protein CopC [Edaphobacter sp.]